MKITPQQFLDKLAASPRDAAEFDACAPAGMNRRDHCVKVLNLVENTIAFNKASKEKLAAAKARIVALERAKASMPSPKATTRPPTAPTAASSVRPYAQEKTDILVMSLRKKYVAGQQAIDAAAELARRGVVIGEAGYSLSKP